jgi:acyl carrier protein
MEIPRVRYRRGSNAKTDRRSHPTLPATRSSIRFATERGKWHMAAIVTERDFLLFFREVLPDYIETVPSNVDLDTDLSELGIDSLSRIELIAAIEDKFEKRIDDSVLRTVRVGRDLLNAFA